ncbi:MAG: aspartate kinase [bacterium]
MIVMKFGGTSVEDAPAIERVIEIVRFRLELRPAVVISAMGKTTRNLLIAAGFSAEGKSEEAQAKLNEIRRYHFDLAKIVVPNWEHSGAGRKLVGYFDELRKLFDGLAILRELTLRSHDKILSYGELMSTAIIADAFRSRGLDTVLLDAREFIITDERFTRAQPIAATTYQKISEHVRPAMAAGQIPIIQGYIGSTRTGATTTLGFEGSDYTAALVGAALGADDIQIWKDVSGLMTADPAIFTGARTVKTASFAEAAELTFFGAKVLHPSAIEPARQKNIPVHIYNSRKPQDTGTVVTTSAKTGTNLIKSIAYKRSLCILNILSNRSFSAYDFLKAVFDILDRERLTPYIMSTAEASVAVALSASENLEFLIADLGHFGEVRILPEKATISLVGENLRTARNVATMVFQQLHGMPIDLISQGASPINFSFALDEANVPEAIAKLHEVFFRELDPAVFE